MSSVISLFENLALVTSGLAITTEVGETDCVKIYSKMSDLYIENLEYWATNAHKFSELAPFMAQLTTIQKQSLGSKCALAGESLWKKYKLQAKGINTIAGPIWAKITNDGEEPPTGTKKAEWLLRLRKSLYAEHEIAKKHPDFKEGWYPPYWLCFLYYGPCAENTASDAFASKRSNGPTSKRPAEALTHREQRELLGCGDHLNRKEIRELERNSKKPKREAEVATLATVMSRANEIEARAQRLKELHLLVTLSPDDQDARRMLTEFIMPPKPAAEAVACVDNNDEHEI